MLAIFLVAHPHQPLTRHPLLQFAQRTLDPNLPPLVGGQFHPPPLWHFSNEPEHCAGRNPLALQALELSLLCFNHKVGLALGATVYELRISHFSCHSQRLRGSFSTPLSINHNKKNINTNTNTTETTAANKNKNQSNTTTPAKKCFWWETGKKRRWG